MPRYFISYHYADGATQGFGNTQAYGDRPLEYADVVAIQREIETRLMSVHGFQTPLVIVLWFTELPDASRLDEDQSDA